MFSFPENIQRVGVQMYMISVQGVGETVYVVKYNVLDTKGRVWEGDSPVRVIPSEGK